MAFVNSYGVNTVSPNRSEGFKFYTICCSHDLISGFSRIKTRVRVPFRVKLSELYMFTLAKVYFVCFGIYGYISACKCGYFGIRSRYLLHINIFVYENLLLLYNKNLIQIQHTFIKKNKYNSLDLP